MLRQKKMKHNKNTIVLSFLSVILAIIVVFPVYWMIVVSTQKGSSLFKFPPGLIPIFKNYDVFIELFLTQPIGRWMLNTLVVSIGTALLSVSLAIPAAYSLSRFKYRMRKPFQVYLLMSQMFPATVIIVPLFVILKRWNLLNSHLGLILVDTGISATIAVWVLKAYFDTIPKELEEAALIDGCSRIMTLVKITLPIAAPAIASSFVICFFEGWNEFTYALTFITDQSKWVASVGMASWIGWLTTPIEIMMAGAAIFTIPSVLLFLIMQKQLVSGLTAGAIK